VHNMAKVSARNRPESIPEGDIQPETPEIPNKLYFRIGDVSKLAGVKPYVLRYWESEFAQLRPKKSGTNQRLYPRKEVELILEIKRLLYDKRFTIEGARKFLEQRSKPVVVPKPVVKARKQAALFAMDEGVPRENWNEVRAELRAILKLLK
jgi:DNA-binding transcriptional MerR regulator